MSASKKQMVADAGRWEPTRSRTFPIAPADYSDEVTPEQMEAVRKKAAPALNAEEWEVVDGPAW